MKRHPGIPSLALVLTLAAAALFFIVINLGRGEGGGDDHKQRLPARLGSHLSSHTKGSEISEQKRKTPACSVSEEQLRLIERAEPLIEEEPLKPWLTLKRNVANIAYLPSLTDVHRGRTNDSRYVYVDVGSRNYGSSIGGWFKKRYPMQGRNFSIFAIEADSAFHAGYSKHPEVTLVPYAAWTSDEKLMFGASDGKAVGQGGMGRIRSRRPESESESEVVLEVQGFDFADWLGRTVRKEDYVVMKMDVEGTEFELIPRLFETGGMCLVDELFLECHYNRWQKCCPERTSKYSATYSDCLALLHNLRDNGVLVHQWW